MSQIREVRFKDTGVTVSYISAVFHSHLLSSPLSSFFISLSAVFLDPNFILCFFFMALTLHYNVFLLISHLFMFLYFNSSAHFLSLSVFLCVPLFCFFPPYPSLLRHASIFIHLFMFLSSFICCITLPGSPSLHLFLALHPFPLLSWIFAELSRTPVAAWPIIPLFGAFLLFSSSSQIDV